MMNQLERYIREQYVQERQELEDIRHLAADALPTVVDSWDNGSKAWPYRAFDKPPPDYSFSTNSMILFMLSIVLERTKVSSLIPRLPENSGFASMLLDRLECDRRDEYKKTMEDIFSQGLDELLAKIKDNTKKDGGAQTKLLTGSSTYGTNDVLSLTWLTELLRVAQISNSSNYNTGATATSKKHDNLRKLLDKAVGKVRKATINGPQLRCLFYLDQLPDRENREPLEHPFPLVRLVQLLDAHHRLKANTTGSRVENRLTETQLGGRTLRAYFEHGLHEQIAFHSIPDSRFDPAFLVFCLEGALRFPTSNVSTETIERALRVLEESQEETPYWRPRTPILTTKKGEVLFPVSVEVANSLLRITDLLDRPYEEPRYFLRCRPLLQRYVRWLRAQRVSKSHRDVGNSRERLFYGWHSENDANPDQIHLWLTSEVIVFLLGYQLRFHDGIGYTMLKASGLQVKRHTTRDHPRDMSPSMYWKHGPSKGSAKGWLQNEPLLGHRIKDSPYLIYDVIFRKYLKPRDSGHEDGGSANYSILLYGPPGIGKTTVCEEIAKALCWPFVIVTPSDFLAGGAAEVEARAKAIFAMLQEQRDTVVLLDEIDHFLLDRESPEYASQEGIFQFMTPGMLTKINDLRRAKRIIFVIATNYEERIDSAIKRPGRIDDKLLLLPPNLAQRNRILQNHYEGADGTKNIRRLKMALHKIARKTALFTYPELEALAKKVNLRDSANDAQFE